MKGSESGTLNQKASGMDRKSGHEGCKTKRTVRFKSGDHPESRPASLMSPDPHVSMVQAIVPHLPGLDPQSLYVISGPFPHQDPTNGTSSGMLMATPLPPGATVVAVPSGPPPPVPGPVQLTKDLTTPIPQPQRVIPCRQETVPRRLHPSVPHVMHWDTHHPTGHPIPLRQPNPPVFFNQPSRSLSPSTGSLSSMCSSDLSSEDSGSNHEGQVDLAKQMANINLGSQQQHQMGNMHPIQMNQYHHPNYNQYNHHQYQQQYHQQQQMYHRFHQQQQQQYQQHQEHMARMANSDQPVPAS